MNKKQKIILLSFFIIFAVMVALFLLSGNDFKPKKSPGSISLTPGISSSISPTNVVSVSPTETIDQNANIIVTSPKHSDTVTLPINIKGKARVFENQLNYRVRDVNKNILLEGNAYANSPDAGEFGDFSIQITALPTMRSNALTLEVFDYSAKDGSEIDTVSIPIIFNPGNSLPVKIFFSSNQAPAGQECTNVYTVERHIVKTQSTARAAIEELLKGPLVIEKDNGYTTNINNGVKLQKVTIVDGIAKADFDKKLDENVGGSCRVAAIRAQITQTLKQFPSVKEVIISVDGRTEDILQP